MINFLFVTALAVVAIYDIKEKRIPNLCVLLIAVLAVIDRLISGRGSFASGIFDVLCVSTPLLMVAVITKGAFGGGDVKLMAAAGLLLGWQNVILAFACGCILGSVIHLVLMKIQGKERMLAFGPYLSAGIWFSMMWGQELIQWYINQF